MVTTEADTPRTTPTAIEQPLTLAPPAANPVQVAFEDPAGDLVDVDGNVVSGPDYIDIKGLDVRVTSSLLEATLHVSGAPPALDGAIDQID